MINREKRNFSETRLSLLNRLKHGLPDREAAWEQFYEKYSGVISAFARRLGAKNEDVADLVQEVMLRFFSASSAFDYDPKNGSFRSYLKVCTWRLLQRQQGKTLRMNGRPIDEVDASELSVDAQWNDVWENETLRRAIETVRESCLPHPDRLKTFRAFQMYVLFEHPAEGVARELGISVDSVHQAKNRITKAVRREMAKIVVDMG